MSANLSSTEDDSLVEDSQISLNASESYPHTQSPRRSEGSLIVFEKPQLPHTPSAGPAEEEEIQTQSSASGVYERVKEECNGTRNVQTRGSPAPTPIASGPSTAIGLAQPVTRSGTSYGQQVTGVLLDKSKTVKNPQRTTRKSEHPPLDSDSDYEEPARTADPSAVPATPTKRQRSAKSSPHSRTPKKPRQVTSPLELALSHAVKLSARAFMSRHSTVSGYVSYLMEAKEQDRGEFVTKSSLLEGTRIVLLNTYSPDRMDIGIRLHAEIIMRHGGELCKASSVDNATHVVPYHIPQTPSPSYFSIANAFAAEKVELPPTTTIVTWEWVSDSLQLGTRLSEKGYLVRQPPGHNHAQRAVALSPGSRSAIESIRAADESFVTTTGPDGSSPLANRSFSTEPEPGGEAEGGMSGLEHEVRLVKQLGRFVDHELDEHHKGDTPPDTDVIYDLSDDESYSQEDGEAKDKREHLDSAQAKRTRYACDDASYRTKGGGGPNAKTAEILEALSKYAEKGSFRERGYRIASMVVRKYPYPITTYAEARKLRGLGDSMAKKIVEIQKSGTHRRLKLLTQRDKCIELFEGIFGVGASVANQLYQSGCRSLSDVQKWPSLTAPQKLGVRYYYDINQRIPREEVTEVFDIVVDIAHKIDPRIQVECMGSYRRKAQTCGDIDILVTRNPSDGKDHTGLIKRIWDDLSVKLKTHVLNAPGNWNSLETKILGLCALPGGTMRRIDILGVPWNEHPFAQLYFTGNDIFNRSMRLKAAHCGYHLNEKGLFKDGEQRLRGNGVTVKSEREIFDILNVPWREPEERVP